MPNNNPHGHNQYTKPELRSQKSKKPSPQPNQSGSTDAPGGRNTTHESDNGNSAGSDNSSATAAGTHTPGTHTASVSHLPVTPVPGSDTAAAATPTSNGAGTPPATGTSRRGFASMDAAMQREIASKGGHSQGRENNPGNFANDREKAREAGRKGGEAHGHR
jgi:general stress protein YciG